MFRRHVLSKRNGFGSFFPLILVVFCLLISGGRALHLHHELQKSASTNGRSQSSVYLAYDDSFSDLEETEEPLALSGDFVFFLDRCGQDLPAWDWANGTSQRHDNRRGLGCGGLPA